MSKALDELKQQFNEMFTERLITGRDYPLQLSKQCYDALEEEMFKEGLRKGHFHKDFYKSEEYKQLIEKYGKE
jgi:hypothetical protein